jgi:hypothetical protein
MYVQGNIEARSRNHSCNGKTINIKYNECVFLPQFFCMQNARFLLSFLAPLDVLYFSTVAHKQRNFLGGGGGELNVKWVLIFCSGGYYQKYT